MPNLNFQLWLVLILISLELQGYTVPNWKALKNDKYEARGLRFSSTLKICQDVLKSVNLLHSAMKLRLHTVT